MTLISYFFSKLNLYKNSIVSELSGSNWMNYWYKKINEYRSKLLKVPFIRGIIFGDDTFIPPLWTLKIEFLASICFNFLFNNNLKKNQKFTLPLFFYF